MATPHHWRGGTLEMSLGCNTKPSLPERGAQPWEGRRGALAPLRGSWRMLIAEEARVQPAQVTAPSAGSATESQL